MNDPARITALDIEAIKKDLEQDPHLKSGHTRRGYLGDLKAFDAWRAGRSLTRLLLEAYAAQLQTAGKAPGSINRALAALRWYARRLAAQVLETPALNEDEQRQRAELAAQAERAAGVENVRGKRQAKGRSIFAGELAGLMAVCESDPSPAGSRDAALVSLAWACGLRRAELAGLRLGDWKITGQGQGKLTITGKGDKQRPAYVYNGAFYALVDWLHARGSSPGPIFCRIHKTGKIQTVKPLSGEALRQILLKRIEEARVKGLTWHDFRRTFIGNLLDNGQDLATVQRLAGHADPSTTSSYDRRGEETRQKAARTLFVPYKGRR